MKPLEPEAQVREESREKQWRRGQAKTRKESLTIGWRRDRGSSIRGWMGPYWRPGINHSSRTDEFVAIDFLNGQLGKQSDNRAPRPGLSQSVAQWGNYPYWISVALRVHKVDLVMTRSRGWQFIYKTYTFYVLLTDSLIIVSQNSTRRIETPQLIGPTVCCL